LERLSLSLPPPSLSLSLSFSLSLAGSTIVAVVIIKRPCGIRPGNKFLVYGSSAGYPLGGSAYRPTKMTVSCSERLDFQPPCRRSETTKEKASCPLCSLSLSRSLACLSIPVPVPLFHHRNAAPRRTLTLSPRGVVRARYRAPAGAITTPMGKM